MSWSTSSINKIKGNADIQFPDNRLDTLAFGSCHKNKVAVSPNSKDPKKPIIWNAIRDIEPQTFLWLGDAIYAPSSTSSSSSSSSTLAQVKKGLKNQMKIIVQVALSKLSKIASIETLQQEYQTLLSNSTIGYKPFLANKPYPSSGSEQVAAAESKKACTPKRYIPMNIFGMYDDHDYGANDCGKQMPNKELRKNHFLSFIQSSNELTQDELSIKNNDNIDNDEIIEIVGFDDEKTLVKNRNIRLTKLKAYYQTISNRDGLYSSIEYSTFPTKVKIILLDTRSGRDLHCPIPSIGAWKLPLKLGSPLACLTRWITAGLGIPSMRFCRDAKMLSEQQWSWLEQQIQDRTSYHSKSNYRKENDYPPSVYIIGSSVQVLTTNPSVESWGHYPSERLRLLKLLNNDVNENAAVLILSGDVHHAEILDSSAGLKKLEWNMKEHGKILEITSSGLTHSCVEPFYGPLCAPILEKFPYHRYQSKKNYYTGRNFGSIFFKWGYKSFHADDSHESQLNKMQINIHNDSGEHVLTTGLQPFASFTSRMTDEQLENIVGVSDGHLITYVKKCVIAFVILFFLRLLQKRIIYRRSKTSTPVMLVKKYV